MFVYSQGYIIAVIKRQIEEHRKRQAARLKRLQEAIAEEAENVELNTLRPSDCVVSAALSGSQDMETREHSPGSSSTILGNEILSGVSSSTCVDSPRDPNIFNVSSKCDIPAA